MPRKIILDVEPGITDILPLCFALLEPELEVLGITVCGTPESLPASLRCVQRILDLIQPFRMPALGVGVGFLPMPTGDWEEFHSLAFGAAMELSSADYFSVQSAAGVIEKILRENPHEVSIVALGPLTNPARVLASSRELAGLLHRLFIVGGTVLEPGNASPVAECNFFRDPAAADWILHSETARTLIPLDVTQKILLDYDIFQFCSDRKKSSLRKNSVSRMNEGVSEFHHLKKSEGGTASEVTPAGESFSAGGVSESAESAFAGESLSAVGVSESAESAFAGESLSAGGVSESAESGLAGESLSAGGVSESANAALVRKMVSAWGRGTALVSGNWDRHGQIFLREIVRRLFQLYREVLGIEGIHVPGLVALQVLLHPENFSGKMMGGEVETEGEKTRGMTVFDRRLRPSMKPDMEVLLETRVGEVRRRIYEFLERLMLLPV